MALEDGALEVSGDVAATCGAVLGPEGDGGRTAGGGRGVRQRAFTSDPRAGRAALKVGAPPEGRSSRDAEGAQPPAPRHRSSVASFMSRLSLFLFIIAYSSALCNFTICAIK